MKHDGGLFGICEPPICRMWVIVGSFVSANVCGFHPGRSHCLLWLELNSFDYRERGDGHRIKKSNEVSAIVVGEVPSKRLPFSWLFANYCAHKNSTARSTSRGLFEYGRDCTF
jgi:hypothetical protein